MMKQHLLYALLLVTLALSSSCDREQSGQQEQPQETEETLPSGIELSCPRNTELVIEAQEYSGHGFCHRENGTRHGPFAMWTPEGELVSKGEYKNGSPSGIWTSWSGGEKRSEGELKAGHKEGLWRWWGPSGTLLMEGSYLKGVRQGRWKIWDEGGTLLEDCEWVRGEQSFCELGQVGAPIMPTIAE